ncbi:porin family protein [Flavobacterium sp. DG1-102-2]|uniref:porin family protein n=1 Tax=Flavobacterium sp. DG1-102-2 TaxID=3081663 RepID=UPI00294A2A0B|nr:porin family protein [Flavobacterium sp. DG1-102-2]MDV6169280.1 porin family protein [Flavobacterium sp. DG1-102-2]
MKKIIGVLISLFALNAAAQVTVKPGVRAGLNLSTITNSELDTKADFYVGGFVAIKFAKFYTLQPEINYSRQGAKGHFESIDFDPVAPPSRQEVDYSLQYVSLTVMNKFTFAESFSVMVGPSLDFKVSDNFTGYAKDDLIGFDLGLNTGIGYTLPIGLTVEARYKLGLIDIFGDNYDYNNDDYYNDNIDDIRLNSVIQLGLAYTF